MGKDPRELFELKERIGKGSFGEVHRAIDKQTSKEVAIKIIDLEKSDGEFFTAFLSIMETSFVLFSELSNKQLKSSTLGYRRP